MTQLKIFAEHGYENSAFFSTEIEKENKKKRDKICKKNIKKKIIAVIKKYLPI